MNNMYLQLYPPHTLERLKLEPPVDPKYRCVAGSQYRSTAQDD